VHELSQKLGKKGKPDNRDKHLLSIWTNFGIERSRNLGRERLGSKDALIAPSRGTRTNHEIT
jgi:hypothetical protein